MKDFVDALATLGKAQPDVSDVHIARTMMKRPRDRKDWRQRKHPQSGQFTASFELAKIDAPEGLVFGWASVVEEAGAAVTDSQGDVIAPEEMEKAAYDFMLNARVAGDMHLRKGVGRLVESIAFTAEKQAALGIDLGKIGHWVGFKIDCPDVLEKIRDGTYAALSIGGRGIRTPIEEAV